MGHCVQDALRAIAMTPYQSMIPRLDAFALTLNSVIILKLHPKYFFFT
ncbi:hypothetical protein LC653_04560 [Nostoc sp. CHAB 5784]|nr:hypothetical protein [Nostoc mirabile CHAB5784]